MSDPASPHRFVLHLFGTSPVSVLPSLAELFASSQLSLVDLFQSRIGGAVVIGAELDCPAPESAQTELERFAAARGLKVSFEPVMSAPRAESSLDPASVPDAEQRHSRICVTLLGGRAGARAIAEVGRVLSDRGLTIDRARALGRASMQGMELLAGRDGSLTSTDFHGLRASLLGLGPELGIDLAVQREDFYRRSKRLLCMDVDSTFVKGEFIDELADLVGVKGQVAEITARAMRGELDFPEALRARVKLLAGLPASRALELCDRFELTPGADELVCTVKQLGLRVGLVSGGFDFFVERLKERYGLDFAFANELEVVDGHLTGEVLGTIVDGARKAQLLKDMAHVFGVRLEQTIAAGDGANDIQMLQAAGLGVAYQAKARLQEVADTRFNENDRLDTLLYLMGFDPVEAIATR